MNRLRAMIFQRSCRQDGFGLVELLIALTILVVGIMGIVAAFGAGILSVQRASRVSTAGTLADVQMERYRALNYFAIKLDETDSDGIGPPDSGIPPGPPYTTDAACGGACDASSQITGGSPTTCAVALRSDPTCPSRTTTGADGDSYRVDVYVKWTCAVGTLSFSSPYTPTKPGCTGATTAAFPAKLVTIVVRDATDPAKALFRESSTFDQAIG